MLINIHRPKREVSSLICTIRLTSVGFRIVHPGHQRLQFTPIIGTGVTLCSFCSYIHNPFSVVGPSVWNGLPLSQRLLPRILSDTFYSSLKTLLFNRASVGSASE